MPWLSQSLTGPAPVAFEAARALGKIRTPAAWSALSRYLASATLTPANAAAIGEALLSIGRFTERQDVAPIVRWTTSQSEEVRWRAAWALFRPRNPAAVTHLLKLTDDPSPEVRFWAMRGLTPALVTEAGLDRDRSPPAFAAPSATAIAACARKRCARLFSTMTMRRSRQRCQRWMRTMRGWRCPLPRQMGRFKSRVDLVVPRLIAAAGASRPLSVRLTALAPLAALSPESAAGPAGALAREKSDVARSMARQTLQKLGDAGKAQLATLEPAGREAGGAAGAAGADRSLGRRLPAHCPEMDRAAATTARRRCAPS